MTAKFTFKSGKTAQVFDFQKVTYPGYDSTTQLTKDDIDKFQLVNEYTYIFEGKNTLVAKGSDIDFILFD